MNKTGSHNGKNPVVAKQMPSIKQNSIDVFEFDQLIGEISIIYGEIFGERIIGIDEIKENELHKFAGRLLDIQGKIKKTIDKENIRDGLSLASVNYNCGRYGISLNYYGSELLDWLAEYQEYNISKTDAKIIGSLNCPWESLLKYAGKKREFSYDGEYFNLELLSTFSEELECLKGMMKTYRNCFTLNDPNEKGYKKLSCNDSLSEIKRFNGWFVDNYKDMKGYFDPETKSDDIKSKHDAMKKKDLKKLIYLIGSHAKKFFLRFFLEKWVISKDYYLYLNSIKDPWETVKELYYIYERDSIAKAIIKKTPDEIIETIAKSIGEILSRNPKDSYRLMYNLNNMMILYSKQVEQICMFTKEKGIRLPFPEIKLPQKGEKILLCKELIIIEH